MSEDYINGYLDKFKDYSGHVRDYVDALIDEHRYDRRLSNEDINYMTCEERMSIEAIKDEIAQMEEEGYDEASFVFYPEDSNTGEITEETFPDFLDDGRPLLKVEINYMNNTCTGYYGNYNEDKDEITNLYAKIIEIERVDEEEETG